MAPGNRKRSIVVLVAAALSLAGLPQTATANSTNISVCVSKKSGEIRQINSKKKCKKSERLLVLNTSGPATTPGPQGPKGETGPQGPQGETGTQGVTATAGSSGAAGPAGQTGATGATGATGPSKVAFYYGQTGAISADRVTIDLYNFAVTESADYLATGTVVLENTDATNTTIASCRIYSDGAYLSLGRISYVTIPPRSKATLPVAFANRSLTPGNGVALRCEIATGEFNITDSTFSVVQVGSVTLIPEPD